ncbi:hypothetical protein TGRUB_222240 [Toxoplasma gondii RUB]|uniref:Uncharacterized protein n=1 Tax=Toxoplasma gondii RUB TaxID=935652 RepID=A0A086LWZ5_TOXGO|nr:hypothetical protein TGRUB_222240 [Toxoplasma gondii RUB]
MYPFRVSASEQKGVTLHSSHALGGVEPTTISDSSSPGRFSFPSQVDVYQASPACRSVGGAPALSLASLSSEASSRQAETQHPDELNPPSFSLTGGSAVSLSETSTLKGIDTLKGDIFRRFRLPRDEDDVDSEALCGDLRDGPGFSPSQLLGEPRSPRQDREMDDDDIRPPQRLNASEELLRFSSWPTGRREDDESVPREMVEDDVEDSSPLSCTAASRLSAASSLATASSASPELPRPGDAEPASTQSLECGAKKFGTGTGRGRKRAALRDESWRNGNACEGGKPDVDAGIETLSRLLAKKCRLNSSSRETEPDFLGFKPIAGTSSVLGSPLCGSAVAAVTNSGGREEGTLPGMQAGVFERILGSVSSELFGTGVSKPLEPNAPDVLTPSGSEWPGDTNQGPEDRPAGTKDAQMSQDGDLDRRPKAELPAALDEEPNFFSACKGSGDLTEEMGKSEPFRDFYRRRKSSCSTSFSADPASPIERSGSRPFLASSSISCRLSSCSFSASLHSGADRAHALRLPVNSTELERVSERKRRFSQPVDAGEASPVSPRALSGQCRRGMDLSGADDLPEHGGDAGSRDEREDRGRRPGRLYHCERRPLPTEKQKRMRMQELLAITRSPPSRIAASPPAFSDPTRPERGAAAVYRSVDLGALRTRTWTPPMCLTAVSERCPERWSRADPEGRSGSSRAVQVGRASRVSVASRRRREEERDLGSVSEAASPQVESHDSRYVVTVEDSEQFLPPFASSLGRGQSGSVYSFSSFSVTSSCLSDSSSILSGETFAPGLAPSSAGSGSGEGCASFASFGFSEGSGPGWLSGAGLSSPTWTGITGSTNASPPVSPNLLASSLTLPLGMATAPPPPTFCAAHLDAASTPSGAPRNFELDGAPESGTEGGSSRRTSPCHVARASSAQAPRGALRVSSFSPSSSPSFATAFSASLQTTGVRRPLLVTRGAPDVSGGRANCIDTAGCGLPVESAPASFARRMRPRFCETDDSGDSRTPGQTEARVIDYVAANRLLREAQFE